MIQTNNVFDTVANIGNSATTAALVIGGLVAIVFIIIMAWKAGGALGAVITAMISAALFVWALNNIADSGVQDQIGNTITNGAPAPGYAPEGS